MDPQLELSRHKRHSSGASSPSYYSQYPLGEEPVTIQSHLDHFDTSTSKPDTNELFHQQDDHHPNTPQPSNRYSWGDGLTLTLFCMILLVPLTTLVSFGLAVAFFTAGSWILNYTSLHAAYESTVITLAFAKLLASGAAIADTAVFLLSLAVAWYAAQCGAPRTAVFWSVEVIGTIMAGTFAAAIGVAVLPHQMREGLTITRALKAGPLGLAAVGVPTVLISGMLYLCVQRKQVLV